MESQKIINILDHKDEDDPKFETKKWYVVNDNNNTSYGRGDDVQSTVKFNTEIVKPFCVIILMLLFWLLVILKWQQLIIIQEYLKTCHPFTSGFFRLNGERVDIADNLDLTMNLYHMLEYNDKYADTTAFSYQYKRPKQNKGDNDAFVK